MKSIRARLLVACLSIIGSILITGLVFFVFQFQITQQYKTISDTMIAEYRLVDTSATLIDSFNTYVKSAGTNSTDSAARIANAKQEILSLTNFLDTSVQDTESRSDYLGFKASIDTLTRQIDASITRFQQGSITDYVTDFNDANKDYGFVRDSGTVLIFGQLKYTSSIRDEIDRIYQATLYAGFAMVFILIIGSILVMLGFASRLTKPMRNLTLAAKQISEGNMDFAIDQRILNQTSEIGILARAFNTMERTLREKIAQLDATTKDATKTAQVILEKNSELERLNTFMVDRELKMIELKKENEALKAK